MAGATGETSQPLRVAFDRRIKPEFQPVAPTGVPVDLRAFKDDHRGDNQRRAGNLD
jgi:hypothetical protein